MSSTPNDGDKNNDRLSDQGQIDPAALEKETGLPLVRSWRAVYLLVAIVFILYVAALTTLTRIFS